MIAVDTNLIVYAHRADSAWHDRASDCLRRLAEGRSPWVVPWPCVPVRPLAGALEHVDAWLDSPSLVQLSEGSEHWSAFRPC